MPRTNRLADAPASDYHPYQTRSDHGADPGDDQHNDGVPARRHDNDRDRDQYRRGRSRDNGRPYEHEDTDKSPRRRSRSPQRSPLRDRRRNHRSRSRSEHRERGHRSRSRRPRHRNHSRGREQTDRSRSRRRDTRHRYHSRRRERTETSRRRHEDYDRRDYRATSLERGRERERREEPSRSPHREPSWRRRPRQRSPSTGFTIYDNFARKRHWFNSGYGEIPEKPYDDLTKHFYTSDMVSIRFCDFSSDTQAAIGQKFTPSSQGMINVKEDVPFIIKRVEPGYLLGWVAHTSGGRGLKETPSIPESEYPKYMGVATEGHSNGSRGNDSPHRLLKVRGFRRSRNLKPKTHVFAGELIKVTLSSRPHLWGQLEPKYYWRLQRLSDFLIASPGTAAGRLDRIPRHFGLDVDALRELRTADDSLDEDMKAGLAHLDAIHKPRPSDDDSDADARSPRGPTTPNGRVPRPTTRQGARDVNTTAPPPATTQGTEKATQPRDQRRLSPTANATRDPRLPPSTGPRVTRPRDDDTASLSNTKRRRGS